MPRSATTPQHSFFWGRAPFLRLLFPLIAGIVLQRELQIPPPICRVLLALAAACLVGLGYSGLFRRFRLLPLTGIATFIIFFATGALLTWHRDIRNRGDWFGWQDPDSALLVATIHEPPIPKPKSFKATAAVRWLVKNGKPVPVSGRINIYFQAAPGATPPGYGTQIIFHKMPEPIRNRGNPGEFDYRRYALLRGITHQVFLKPGEFRVLAQKRTSQLKEIIFAARERVLGILRKNIREGPELGVAEALLIGHKDDLDRDLLQRYANTGVVHIIAISGLHLGLIYWMLRVLLRPLSALRKTRWLAVLLTLLGLWGFSLLAGAQPSILRAAVMFSCLALGENLGRNSSIYNSIACSAFLLLCHNPYWLWDIGFQLSYAAVLSIVIFMRPVYHLLFLQNRILDGIWKLNAVTVAAQILSFPICTFYFHQFPNYFILANLLAVPLSTLILFAEILLCFMHFSAPAALLGDCIEGMIGLMNNYIARIESLPHATWRGLQVSLLQTAFLYGMIAAASAWLFFSSRLWLRISLATLLLFAGCRFHSFFRAESQRKIIVYDIPGQVAVDFVAGRQSYFLGNGELRGTEAFQRFVEPARTKFRFWEKPGIPGLQQRGACLEFQGKKIIHLNSPVRVSGAFPCEVDLLLVSGNPRVSPPEFTRILRAGLIVIGNSVPPWVAEDWKRQARRLGLSYHDIRQDGALVLDF